MTKQPKPGPLDVVPKKKTTRDNRQAGHDYERECAIELRNIGFKHVVCSRNESVSRDAEKIDLMNRNEAKNGRLPYNIQCKNSSQIPRYPEILLSGKVPFKFRSTGLRGETELNGMPKIEGVVNVVFHKFTQKSEGGRFMTKGEFAILEKEDFLAMVKELELHRAAALKNCKFFIAK